MTKVFFVTSQLSKTKWAEVLDFGKQILTNIEEKTQSMAYSHNIAHGVYNFSHSL